MRALPQPPPGFEYRPDQHGQPVLVASNKFPEGRTSGQMYERGHALGQHPQEFDVPAAYKDHIQIPAFYTVSILLGGNSGDTAANSTPIRPEPFILRRITWATTGDAPAFITVPSVIGSAQGRCVTAQWSDEFTKFLGEQPCLVSALFGDSEGYLDLPKRGLLFQGRQTLKVQLHRLLWPDPESEAATTQWDFNFQGVGLLPQGVNQSGSAG